jgi:hypothetical protein
MGVAKSFRDVFIVNNPALLGSGAFSTALAISQIGIFNYDVKKDRLSVSAPNFAVNKAIQLIVGTPQVPTNLLGAIADQSKVSKPIKGKKILSWTGRAAKRGQTQIVAVGYDGFDQTKTISAQCEEHKTVFLKLSGGPIDQGFHTDGRGLVRQYSIFSGCCDDCGNDCASTNAEAMADDLVNQINTDPILSLGSATNSPYSQASFTNRLVRAKKIVAAIPPTPPATCQQYLLQVCDNGDDVSLGAVQAQYPSGNTTIDRVSRSGSTSTYEIILPSTAPAPQAFNNSGIETITDCATCPPGYTLTTGLYATRIQRQDAGTAGALATLKSDYGIVNASGETAVNILYQFGQSTYIVTKIAPITVPVGTDTIEALNGGFVLRSSCLITSPTTIAWTLGYVGNVFNQTYQLTLSDNVCGQSQLSALQNAYPSLVIVDNGPGEGGACVHQYQTVVSSGCVAPDCPVDAPIFIAPDAYLGISWVAVPAAENNVVVGVTVESAYVDLIASECAFDYWRYDAEPIFIEVSQHSQDYNDQPTICAGDWPVTEIQPVQLPIGVGSQVREQEAFFKGYERKYRDENPIVRQYQDSLLQTDPLKYYDQYTIEFEFDYHEFWFSEKFTDTYRVEVYFPEGTGGAFQSAINSYVASVGIELDPVVII